MAHKRMFSKDITGSDAFREMPQSSQALYFHLGMEADDDGFLDNYKGLIRGINASEDDLKILLTKRFLILFPSKVIVVKHWLINNTVRADRYKETKHLDEKRALIIKENGSYTELGIPNGNQMATQKRIGEDSRDTKKSPFIPDGKLTTEPDPDENGRPVKEKKDVPMPHEWVEIWNRYSTWKATGKSGTPPNPSALKQLLPIARQTRDLTAAIIKKRGKYSTEEFEFATRQYAMEICNRTKDKSSFYLHRFPLYEFLTHKGIFEKYVNR